jgi:hypothetical protein
MPSPDAGMAISMPGQLRPGTTAGEFRAHRAAFVDAMHRAAGVPVPWPADLFNPYPFVLDQAGVQRLMALGRAVHAGIHAVVRNFAGDERIRARYALDPRLVAILDRARGRPYTIGMFRPDFVIDEGGEFRVCEINARFSANGYAINDIVDCALRAVTYLPPSLRRIKGMSRIRSAMTAAFRDGHPVAIILKSESGSEIFMLLSDLEWYTIAPAELTIDSRRPATGDAHVILELDRMELLDLAPDVLDHIIRNGSRNDVRTLILVHDKRLLSVLSDPAIMRDYVDAATAGLLAHHIIPTRPASHARGEALADQEEWVIKPNSGGRGVDVLIGGETPRGRWEARLRDHAADDTLQRFVKQRRFPIRHLADDELQETEMNVVGLLPCFEDQVFGPGIFRAGTGSVINVHQQRGEILPCMQKVDSGLVVLDDGSRSE